MRILISPTAYKGTLSPCEAACIMERAVRKKYPKAKTRIFPLADGGDGTLEVLRSVSKGRRVFTRVRGPLGKPVRAQWAILPDGTAIIEMARASGLALVRGKNRVMEATSYGTGQLIRSALDHGCRQIVIGVGGTACAEGGAGALRALGLRYLDAKGRELSEKPVDLARLSRFDWKDFDPRVRKTRLIVLCDVKNPLLGSTGSARIYAPQKGATPAQVRQIEKALAHWSGFARREATRLKGAGAAGALAFGLAGFAGARLMDGTRFILRRLGWERAAKKSDFILTGEGRLDKTSFSGKVIGEIARRRGSAQVLAVCGSTPFSQSALRRRGISKARQMGPKGLKSPQIALIEATEQILSEYQ